MNLYKVIGLYHSIIYCTAGFGQVNRFRKDFTVISDSCQKTERDGNTFVTNGTPRAGLFLPLCGTGQEAREQPRGAEQDQH